MGRASGETAGAHAPTAERMVMVARRFRTLAEPARLRVLHALQDGEASVSALAVRTTMPTATLSRHLQVLYESRFVRRRRMGQFIVYRLADDEILQLCELMCGRLAVELESVRGALALD